MRFKKRGKTKLSLEVEIYTRKHLAVTISSAVLEEAWLRN